MSLGAINGQKIYMAQFLIIVIIGSKSISHILSFTQQWIYVNEWTRVFFLPSSCTLLFRSFSLMIIIHFFRVRINSYFTFKKKTRPEKVCKNINSILLRYSLRFTWNKIYIHNTCMGSFCFPFFFSVCFVNVEWNGKKFYWKLYIFVCHLFRFVSWD